MTSQTRTTIDGASTRSKEKTTAETEGISGLPRNLIVDSKNKRRSSITHFQHRSSCSHGNASFVLGDQGHSGELDPKSRGPTKQTLHFSSVPDGMAMNNVSWMDNAINELNKLLETSNYQLDSDVNMASQLTASSLLADEGEEIYKSRAADSYLDHIVEGRTNRRSSRESSLDGALQNEIIQVNSHIQMPLVDSRHPFAGDIIHMSPLASRLGESEHPCGISSYPKYSTLLSAMASSQAVECNDHSKLNITTSSYVNTSAEDVKDHIITERALMILESLCGPAGGESKDSKMPLLDPSVLLDDSFPFPDRASLPVNVIPSFSPLKADTSIPHPEGVLRYSNSFPFSSARVSQTTNLELPSISSVAVPGANSASALTPLCNYREDLLVPPAEVAGRAFSANDAFMSS